MTNINTWGADGLVMRGNEIYLCDPLGNVAVRTDLDGTVLASDAYDAWGNLLACKDPLGNDYTLTGDPYGYKAQVGYYTDRETGLILCTHRYYDPGTGRWLTRDPIGYDGGINLYQYCGNDPVNGVDPEGLECWFFNPMIWDGNEEDWSAGAIEAFYKMGIALAIQINCSPLQPGNVFLLYKYRNKIGQLYNLPVADLFFGSGVIDRESMNYCCGNAAANLVPMLFIGPQSAYPNNSNLRFSQITASPTFSREGNMAGRRISEIVEQLRSRSITPSQLPVRVIFREGKYLIVNTRSALALMRAKIPVGQWKIINMTSDAITEAQISARLIRNGLTNAGTSVLRITGAGSNASLLH